MILPYVFTLRNKSLSKSNPIILSTGKWNVLSWRMTNNYILCLMNLQNIPLLYHFLLCDIKYQNVNKILNGIKRIMFKTQLANLWYLSYLFELHGLASEFQEVPATMVTFINIKRDFEKVSMKAGYFIFCV